MARKKKHEEHENHERWLVSYADFITLLFAFFVVMYALSSVNEGKYRVLSDSLVSAFNAPPKSIEPVQIGDPIKAPQELFKDFLPPVSNVNPIRPPIHTQKSAAADPAANPAGQNKLNNIADKLEMALGKMIERDLINVHKNDNWIEVEINSSILFNSGSALLQPQAIPVLTEIARILRDFPNAIRVEGYTDNVPIETSIYPSNWELSAGRAASVVHLFSDERVDPFRMSAIGYGEYRPSAANTTPEGRSRNRRVVVLILSESADKLLDRGGVTTLKGGEQPVRDVNLDASLPIIQETSAPSKESKAKLNTPLEEIVAPAQSSSPVAQKRGTQ